MPCRHQPPYEGAGSFIRKNGLKTAAEVKAAALKFVLSDTRVHTLNLAFNTFDDVQSFLALSGQPLGGRDRALLCLAHCQLSLP